MLARPRSGRVRRLLVAALVGTVALGIATTTAGASPAPAPERTRAPADDGVGRWQVTRTGPGTYEVSWRSPRRLPVASDRPTIVLGGTPVGVPTMRADGRTVVTTVRAPERPDPAELDVVLSGDRLDHPGRDVTGVATAPTAPARRSARLPEDPAQPGAYDVASSDYELDPVKLPRMPEPIEMVGHVVEPAPGADTGPRPLVLFLHGRHSFCYLPGDRFGDGWDWPCRPPFEEIPSHLGYDYIQRVLASQGFTTVSIRVNGINAQDFRLSDGGADARARIVQRHLDHWTSIADEHQVDLSRVVLVGHSRGGEGVNRATIQIPLSAPYRIVGQVLLAPTDFGTQTAPYVPTVTVLPYCDGDVFDLQGQRFTDSARDLADDDTSLKSSVMVLGANHNFFNTEWTPGISQAPSWDDWSAKRGVCGKRNEKRLTAAEQQQVGIAYVTGAVQLFGGGDQDLLPLFDGSAVRPPSIGDADVRSHAIGGGRELRRPALDAGLSLPSGAEASFCRGVLRVSAIGACGRDNDLWGQVPHWYDFGEFAPPRRALELTWTEAGQSGGLVFDEPLDLSERRLELRSIVDPKRGNVRIRLRLTDAAGESAEITPAGDGTIQALPHDRQVAKRWAQSVVADPAAATGIDLSRVTRIDVIGDSADGRMWILDVAAAPDSLADVPERRLPVVSLGSLRLTEGDEPGISVASLPFTISGDLTAPARLTVGVVDDSRRASRSRLRVDLAPGQTEGQIRFEYSGNTIDDLPRRQTGYYAFAVRGVMTDKYDGRVVLLDDDPAPKVRVRTPQRVREGRTVKVQLTLSAATGYDTFVGVEVVAGTGPGRRLSVGDVPRRWLEQHFVRANDPDRPLHRAGLFLFDRLRSGQRSSTLSIPVLADRVREGKERVSLRIRFNRSKVVRTIRVVD